MNVANRVKMMHKRMDKMIYARRELPLPRLYGAAPARTGIIAFGGTTGPCPRGAGNCSPPTGLPTRLPGADAFPVQAHTLEPFLEWVDVGVRRAQLLRPVRAARPRGAAAVPREAPSHDPQKYDGFSFRARKILPGAVAGGLDGAVR